MPSPAKSTTFARRMVPIQPRSLSQVAATGVGGPTRSLRHPGF